MKLSLHIQCLPDDFPVLDRKNLCKMLRICSKNLQLRQPQLQSIAGSSAASIASSRVSSSIQRRTIALSSAKHSLNVRPQALFSASRGLHPTLTALFECIRRCKAGHVLGSQRHFSAALNDSQTPQPPNASSISKPAVPPVPAVPAVSAVHASSGRKWDTHGKSKGNGKPAVPHTLFLDDPKARRCSGIVLSVIATCAQEFVKVIRVDRKGATEQLGARLRSVQRRFELRCCSQSWKSRTLRASTTWPRAICETWIRLSETCPHCLHGSRQL